MSFYKLNQYFLTHCRKQSLMRRGVLGGYLPWASPPRIVLWRVCPWVTILLVSKAIALKKWITPCEIERVLKWCQRSCFCLSSLLRLEGCILPYYHHINVTMMMWDGGSYLSIVHRYFVCVMQLMNVFKTLNKENFMGQPFYLTWDGCKIRGHRKWHDTSSH